MGPSATVQIWTNELATLRELSEAIRLLFLRTGCFKLAAFGC